MSEISEKAIKLINDLRRDISIDIMFTPERNAEDKSLKALVDYIAELEALVERLIEAGEKMQALIGWSTGDEATKDWDALVKDWKEREKNG